MQVTNSNGEVVSSSTIEQSTIKNSLSKTSAVPAPINLIKTGTSLVSLAAHVHDDDDDDDGEGDKVQSLLTSKRMKTMSAPTFAVERSATVEVPKDNVCGAEHHISDAVRILKEVQCASCIVLF